MHPALPQTFVKTKSVDEADNQELHLSGRVSNLGNSSSTKGRKVRMKDGGCSSARESRTQLQAARKEPRWEKDDSFQAQVDF